MTNREHKCPRCGVRLEAEIWEYEGDEGYQSEVYFYCNNCGYDG